MANQHAVAASGITVVTTAETVLATMSPFTENQDPSLGQGIAFDGSINLLVGTGGTAATVRVRKGGLAGALVGVAQVQTVTAGATVNVPIGELDPTVAQSNVTYVVTVQLTGASANSTVNRVVFLCQDATAYE